MGRENHENNSSKALGPCCFSLSVEPPSSWKQGRKADGLVQLDVSNRRPIYVKILVVDETLLGFNQLLRLDAIKKLEGVCMTSDRTVNFPQLTDHCAQSLPSMSLTFMWYMTRTESGLCLRSGSATSRQRHK